MKEQNQPWRTNMASTSKVKDQGQNAIGFRNEGIMNHASHIRRLSSTLSCCKFAFFTWQFKLNSLEPMTNIRYETMHADII